MSKLRDMGFVKFYPDDPAHIAWRERVEARITAPRGVGVSIYHAPPMPMRVPPAAPAYDANRLPDAPAEWDEVDKASGVPLEAFVDRDADPIDATVADVD